MDISDTSCKKSLVGKSCNFISLLSGLHAFIYLLSVCIVWIMFIMASIMSVEELTNIYKVKVESATVPTIWRPLMFTLPTVVLEMGPTVPLQPVTNVSTTLSIFITFCMVIFCVWKHSSHMSLVQRSCFVIVWGTKCKWS